MNQVFPSFSDPGSLRGDPGIAYSFLPHIAVLRNEKAAWPIRLLSMFHMKLSFVFTSWKMTASGIEALPGRDLTSAYNFDNINVSIWDLP